MTLSEVWLPAARLPGCAQKQVPRTDTRPGCQTAPYPERATPGSGVICALGQDWTVTG